jgi:hypothetical protein
MRSLATYRCWHPFENDVLTLLATEKIRYSSPGILALLERRRDQRIHNDRPHHAASDNIFIR